MDSQKKKILELFGKRKAASVRDIFVVCGCNSPTKVISDLRREGYRIEDRWVTKNGKRWKEYYLRKEQTA